MSETAGKFPREIKWTFNYIPITEGPHNDAGTRKNMRPLKEFQALQEDFSRVYESLYVSVEALNNCAKFNALSNNENNIRR